MSAEEQLRTLLQTYLAEYTLYATLLLTGAIGALSVLQIRAATRRGRVVFTAAYTVLVGIVMFSVWRLIQFSKSVDIVTQKLNLENLQLEVQKEEAWFYYFFRWAFQNANLVTLTIVVLASIVFFFMWVEVERYVKEADKT